MCQDKMLCRDVTEKIFKDYRRGGMFHSSVSATKDILFVVFAGHDNCVGLIQRYDFVAFLQREFKTADRLFVRDLHRHMYHSGIEDATHSVDESVGYLREKMRGYRRVVFMGVSSGGYAAILYGSLVHASAVVAFIPQTRLEKKEIYYDKRYADLLPIVNADTRYTLAGDPNETTPCHHMSHCSRLAHLPNVHVLYHPDLKMKRLRDNGKLRQILNDVVSKLG